MTDQLVPRDMYRNLPQIYDAAGFSDYVTQYTPLYFNYLQESGWIGRRVLDIGTGTGVSALFFSEQRMFTTAIDSSAGMIQMAQRRLDDAAYDVTLLHEDVRRYKPSKSSFDLMYCVGNVLNYIASIRDLEHVFQVANVGLEMEKVFLFDLSTVRSLAQDFGTKVHIVANDPQLFVVQENRFDYETSLLVEHFYFFYQQASGQFARDEEIHILRGYPFRAVVGMLNRTGFEVQAAMNTELEEFDPTRDARAIVVAQKVREL